ncbi:hypothetical protein PINS_up006054 [Pythium insidiosum]|nr:hypothetical protein PINS_up006054 [Pythium insidiosum]
MNGTTTELCVQLCRTLEHSVGQTVDLTRIFGLFTADVFTRIAFGVELRGLESDSTHPFYAAFEQCSAAAVRRFRVPPWLWRLQRWCRIGAERELADSIAFIDNTVEQIVAECLDRSKTSSRGTSLVALFLQKEPNASPKDVRDLALSFIAAGRDSTALTMAWFILQMNRHPHILCKVQAELDAKLIDGRPIPTVDDVQSLVYLEAALRETLRLCPTVPLTPRVALVDSTLPDCTEICAGTRVLLAIYALCRSPHVWGTDAETFRPERWLVPSDPSRLIPVSAFRYPVFLAGPRRCLGERFAMLEMKIVLATLLARFELVTTRDPHEFTYRSTITLSILGPLSVVASRRSRRNQRAAADGASEPNDAKQKYT